MKCYVSMRCEKCENDEIQTVILHFLLKVMYWVNIPLFKKYYIILFQNVINKITVIIINFITFRMNVNSYTTIGKLVTTTSTL